MNGKTIDWEETSAWLEHHDPTKVDALKNSKSSYKRKEYMYFHHKNCLNIPHGEQWSQGRWWSTTAWGDIGSWCLENAQLLTTPFPAGYLQENGRFNYAQNTFVITICSWKLHNHFSKKFPVNGGCHKIWRCCRCRGRNMRDEKISSE